MQESKFNLATGFNGGVSLSVRADSSDELLTLVSDLQRTPLAGLLVGVPALADGQTALHVVQTAIPAAQVVPFPAPQAAAPLPVPPPVVPAAAAPAAGPAPSCAHGPMAYRAAGFSQRTNKSYPAFWSCQWPNRDEQCKSQNA